MQKSHFKKNLLSFTPLTQPSTWRKLITNEWRRRQRRVDWRLTMIIACKLCRTTNWHNRIPSPLCNHNRDMLTWLPSSRCWYFSLSPLEVEISYRNQHPFLSRRGGCVDDFNKSRGSSLGRWEMEISLRRLSTNFTTFSWKFNLFRAAVAFWKLNKPTNE